MVTKNKITSAMILAAGEGTRMRPLTLETPKVLLPINGTPLICYMLAWLKSHGVYRVAINLHHLGEKIKGFLGDGSRFGVEIFYSQEETVLGTAGGVKKIEDVFDGTFIVVYGDILTDFDLTAMVDFHLGRKALATLALFRAPDPSEVGVVRQDGEGRITGFVEKPPRGAALGNLANGGVYILEKQVLDYIPTGQFSDFAYHIFPRLLEEGLPVYGYVLSPRDFLLDIGTPQKYAQANQDVKDGRIKLKYAP